MNRLLAHAKSNVVAYLALFVALGGTGYAAVNLPAGSVGSAQLRNQSITPAKFDRRFINGTVRAWVVAGPDGRIQASAGTPFIRVTTGGSYEITWRKVARPTAGGCFAIGGVTGENGAGSASALLLVPPKAKSLWRVGVGTYGAQGQLLAQSFYAAVVC